MKGWRQMSDSLSGHIYGAYREVVDNQEQMLLDFFGSYENAKKFGRYFSLDTEIENDDIRPYLTGDNSYKITFVTKIQMLPRERLEELGLYPLSEEFVAWAIETSQKKQAL